MRSYVLSRVLPQPGRIVRASFPLCYTWRRGTLFTCKCGLNFSVLFQNHINICSQVFSLQELRALLDFADFESLLEASFKTYVRTNSTVYQYCPTPDCPSIYCLPAKTSAENLNDTQESASSTSFLCIACLTTICAHCNVIYHDAMTCAEYKDSSNSEALQALKREMGWQDCPRCETSIEKTEGCNHVECTVCGVHICWVCLQTFEDANDCYVHMTDVHGGIGLPDRNEAIVADILFGLFHGAPDGVR